MRSRRSPVDGRPPSSAISTDAAFLRERLASSAPRGAGASRAVREWMRTATRDDPELFRRRLALEGLGEEDLARLGAPLEVDAAWRPTLERIIDAVSRRAPADRDIAPVVAVGAAMLQERAGPALRGLAPAGRAGLEDWLARRQFALHADVMRAGEETLLRSYRRFPVLARLAASLVELWVDAAAEWLKRLVEDRSALVATFGGGGELGDVTAVGAGISDPHRGGRGTIVATFASGVRVVYKPRDLRLERWYQALLASLNGVGLNPPVRTLEVLCRDGYGWVENVEAASCIDETSTERFWRRAGELLAVSYALNATDLHSENVIAAGEHPVIVDTEMLLYADERFAPVTRGGEHARERAGEALRQSVLATGLLPGVPVESAADLSGFAGGPGAARAHADALTAGFMHGYRAILRERDAWLAPGGLLDAARGAPVRFMFRTTQTYGLVLGRAMRADALRDGVAFGAWLDLLARPFASGLIPSFWWPLHGPEQDALERLDVPYFSLPADSDVLEAVPGSTLPFAASPLERTRRRIAALDEEDLAFQVRLARAALGRPQRSGAPPQGPVAPGPGDDLLATVHDLAAAARDAAITAPDGSAAWILTLPAPGHRADAYGRLEVAGDDIYEGAGGIALFLAAYGRALDAPWAVDLALAGVAGLRARLHDADTRRRLAADTQIGVSGLGSHVYVLARLAELTGEDALREDAALAAGLLGSAPIDRDRGLDVMAGSAGAILVLLAHGGPGAVETAAACGRHLLEARLPDGSWPTVEGRSLPGMAHGAAGIAYALLALAGATGERGFREAAAAAFAWEDVAFGEDPGSWCYGAPGMALARAAALPWLDDERVQNGLDRAVARTLDAGLADLDHLCCGTAGRIDALITLGTLLERPDLVAAGRSLAEAMVARAEAEGHLRVDGAAATATYAGSLFKGTAGVGYALLRTLHPDAVPPVTLFA